MVEKRKPTRSMIRPMLASPVDQPFDRAGWLFEVKWDGYRAIAEIEQGNVRLYSRNQLSYAERFPAIVKALQGLGRDAILDGELVVVDVQGRSQFQLLQQYQQTGRGTLIYYVFDLLALDGAKLEARPLVERKQLLRDMLPDVPQVRISEHIERTGIAFFEAARQQQLEGIVAKKASSPYRQGQRGPDWLKVKTRGRTEAIIVGFTEPRGSRAEFGTLVLGMYQGDKLIYVGRVGSGFDNKLLTAVRARLEPLRCIKCPITPKPPTDTPARWVLPELVCEVAYQEWTSDGQLRNPVFLGLRDDKPASTVFREELRSVSELAADATEQPALAKLRKLRQRMSPPADSSEPRTQ